MMNNYKKITALAATAGLLVITGTASAAAVIYESFSYTPANTVLSGKGPATGLSGTWTTSGSNQAVVRSAGLTFTGLSTTGGAAQRSGAPNGSDASIGLTVGAQTALTLSGTSIYFTLLVRTDRNSVGNENLTFAFGTDKVDDATAADGGVAGNIANNGNGFGFTVDNVTNQSPSTQFDFYGYKSVSGATNSVASQSSTFFNTGTTAVQTLMFAGQIDWVASGNDILTLYNIGDVTATALPTSFATMSADFDQSLFDTISFQSRQLATLDEIRFGTSWSDVGLGVVPEPSSALLGGLGFLALLRRRRA